MKAMKPNKADLLSEKSLLGVSCLPMVLIAIVFLLSSCDDARNHMPRTFKPIAHPHFTKTPTDTYVFITGTDLAFAKRAPEIYNRQLMFSKTYDEIDHNFEAEKEYRKQHYSKLIPQKDVGKIQPKTTDSLEKAEKEETKATYKDMDDFFNLIANEKIDDVKEAITKGADINAFDDNTKLNAIMMAARYNKSTEIIQILVDAGANVKTTNDEGLNALMVASRFNRNISIHEKLIALGIDVNEATSKGVTALMLAAGSNPDIRVTAVLLRAKARVNPEIASHGIPPIIIAARFTQNPDIINLLVTAGANVNIKLGDGNTPLLNAARYNTNTEVIRMLLKHNADIEAPLRNGATPLILAARYNQNPDVVVLLIEEGANLLAKDNLGNNALFYADDNSNLIGTPSYFYLSSETETAIVEEHVAANTNTSDYENNQAAYSGY